MRCKPRQPICHFVIPKLCISCILPPPLFFYPPYPFFESLRVLFLLNTSALQGKSTDKPSTKPLNWYIVAFFGGGGNAPKAALIKEQAFLHIGITCIKRAQSALAHRKASQQWHVFVPNQMSIDAVKKRGKKSPCCCLWPSRCRLPCGPSRQVSLLDTQQASGYIKTIYTQELISCSIIMG